MSEEARKSCKEYYHRKKAAGICPTCGSRPAVPGKIKCEVCLESHRTSANACHAKLKEEVFRRYGGLQCACCLEFKDIRFLHIDHKEGGGNAHRKLIGGHSGGKFYRWLKKEGWPPGFQVLCADCNTAKGYYGKCPHEEQRDDRLRQTAGISTALLY
jgi:hypothetical protein